LADLTISANFNGTAAPTSCGARTTARSPTGWGTSTGGFVDNSAVASQPLDLSLQIDGVGDFNGDGKADVLVQWSDGTLQTWVGNPTGAILSPMEKQWQDAFADAQAFMAERAAAMAEVAGYMAQVSAAEINEAVQSVHMPTPHIDDLDTTALRSSSRLLVAIARFCSMSVFRLR
jgi:hypothetical protein